MADLRYDAERFAITFYNMPLDRISTRNLHEATKILEKYCNDFDDEDPEDALVRMIAKNYLPKYYAEMERRDKD